MDSCDYFTPSAETFSCLIEVVKDAILIKDGEGRYLVANNAAKTLFKLQGINWQGKTNKELSAQCPDMRALHEACSADDEVT